MGYLNKTYTMKTQIKTLGFSLLFGASLFAQQGKQLSPEEKINKHVDRLEKQLELSPDQKEKIKAESIILHKQLNELKPSKEERMAHKLEKQKHKEAVKAEISPLLTEEQKQKLAELETKRKEKRKAHKKQHDKKRLSPSERAEKRTNRMDKAVGLSEEQKQKITAIHLASIEKKQAKKEAFQSERSAKKEKKQ